MPKQRSDIMQDDKFIIMYLIVVCTIGTFLGMSMA